MLTFTQISACQQDNIFNDVIVFFFQRKDMVSVVMAISGIFEPQIK